jgi:hydroxyethylthiazole kinase-like uncharacterized protein yjeF
VNPVEHAEVSNLKLVTGTQMAEIDRATIDSGVATGAELMERAGARVVEVIHEEWDSLDNLHVVVVCGKGNNGGDGFVVSRLLHSKGARPRTFLAARADQVRGDAAHHLELLRAEGGDVEPLVSSHDMEVFETALQEAEIVVDALLGNGVKGAPRPELAGVIKRVAACRRPVISVDLPSGVDADTGEVPGACIKAAITVTFGLPKVGQMFFPGREHCGVLRLVDIGFPDSAIEPLGVTTELLTEESVACMIPRRPGDAHKGSCGSVAVVAGSVGMTGAAFLTAHSALRSGAGRVTLGVPSSLNDVMEIKLTEAMTRPLPEVRKHRCLSLRALGEVTDLLQKKDCLALGPGLGRHRETMELIRRVVAVAPLPLVLDADGLNAFAGAVDILGRRTAPTILTPHFGEFSRLAQTQIADIAADPIAAASRFAAEYEVVVVLKGAPTVIALPDGGVVVNPTGNPGMATAGSGDVLAGVIAGFVAQGLECAEAAQLGVYIHGRAGDMARDELGEWGLLAADIAAGIPPAMLDAVRAPKNA